MALRTFALEGDPPPLAGDGRSGPATDVSGYKFLGPRNQSQRSIWHHRSCAIAPRPATTAVGFSGARLGGGAIGSRAAPRAAEPCSALYRHGGRRPAIRPWRHPCGHRRRRFAVKARAAAVPPPRRARDGSRNVPCVDAHQWRCRDVLPRLPIRQLAAPSSAKAVSFRWYRRSGPHSNRNRSH